MEIRIYARASFRKCSDSLVFRTFQAQTMAALNAGTDFDMSHGGELYSCA
jgi:hypothetical protein